MSTVALFILLQSITSFVFTGVWDWSPSPWEPRLFFRNPTVPDLRVVELLDLHHFKAYYISF